MERRSETNRKLVDENQQLRSDKKILEEQVEFYKQKYLALKAEMDQKQFEIKVEEEYKRLTALRKENDS